jgi:hypothetical protein
MNDTRELSQQGRNTPLAFLNQTSLARWAPIPLRLMLGYGFMHRRGRATEVEGAEE